MNRSKTQSGFSAVELLITLFVAAAFLIAGYQLFNVVIKDGGETRAEAKASNIAYDYLRRYSNAATNPCTSQTALANLPITVQDLVDVSVSVNISCPQTDAPTLSKIESIVTYGDAASTVRYATFVDKSTGASPFNDVVNGLVAWWKFNGNANTEVGEYNGTIINATPDTGQNGQVNSAYTFNGSNSYIQIPAGLSNFQGGLTLSTWARPTSAGSYARFLDFGNGPSMGNIVWSRMGTSSDLYISLTTGGGTSQGVFTAPGILVNSQWRHYAVTIPTSGNAVFYVNGNSVATASMPVPDNVTRNLNYIGRSNWAADAYYAGSLDDMRIYSRALSASEVMQLYTGGAK